jgi:hypothetical protein
MLVTATEGDLAAGDTSVGLGPAIKVSAEEFNQAHRKYNQPTIDFAQILLPGETIEEWMQEFRAANRGGYLLRYAKKGMQTNDYLLWYGSAKQATLKQQCSSPAPQW